MERKDLREMRRVWRQLDPQKVYPVCAALRRLISESQGHWWRELRACLSPREWYLLEIEVVRGAGLPYVVDMSPRCYRCVVIPCAWALARLSEDQWFELKYILRTMRRRERTDDQSSGPDGMYTYALIRRLARTKPWRVALSPEMGQYIKFLPPKQRRQIERLADDIKRKRAVRAQLKYRPRPQHEAVLRRHGIPYRARQEWRGREITYSCVCHDINYGRNRALAVQCAIGAMRLRRIGASGAYTLSSDGNHWTLRRNAVRVGAWLKLPTRKTLARVIESIEAHGMPTDLGVRTWRVQWDGDDAILCSPFLGTRWDGCVLLAENWNASAQYDVGIYAYPYVYGDPAAATYGQVTGIVRAIGEQIIGQSAWRAQGARILSLQVCRRDKDYPDADTVAAALRKRYKVDVTIRSR